MQKKIVLATSLTVILLIMIRLEIEVPHAEIDSTLKANDWIEYAVTITPSILGEITPTKVKFEVLNLTGTNATVQATMRLSDGVQEIDTMTIDSISGSGTGLIIPSNSKLGDLIYIVGYGNLTITSELALTYTGVSRIAVGTNFSNPTHNFTGYWDKQSGIMLEQRNTIEDSTTIYKMKDTNLWLTHLDDPTSDPTIYYIAIIGVMTIAVSVIFLRMRKKSRKHIRRKRR